MALSVELPRTISMLRALRILSQNYPDTLWLHHEKLRKNFAFTKEHIEYFWSEERGMRRSIVNQRNSSSKHYPDM